MPEKNVSIKQQSTEIKDLSKIKLYE